MLSVSLKKNGGFREVDWHVGEKLMVSPEDISLIESCYIDGHELEYFKDVSLLTEPGGSQRVIKLSQNSAKLVVFHLINVTKGLKKPTISEQGINTLLKGRQNPENN